MRATVASLGAALCASLALGHPGATLASAPAPAGAGRMTAVSAGVAPPAGTPVRIEYGDGAQLGHAGLYDAARTAAEAALRRRGLAVMPDAALVLAFRIETGAYDFAALPPREPPAPRDRAGIGALRPEVENQVRIPVGPPPRGAAPSYALHVDLYRPGQPPLWTATVQADADVERPDRLVGCMTAAAMASLGASAARTLPLAECTRAPA
ncbi:MAG: hypothetical protein AB7K86_02090 [Rhodospirillales bacterium]